MNQGVRIHASISKLHMEKFTDILQEGSVYSVVDFVVGSNRAKIKTTSGEHKIMIFKCTRIFKIFREEFPKNMFEFKSFDDVKTMDNNAPTFGEYLILQIPQYILSFEELACDHVQ